MAKKKSKRGKGQYALYLSRKIPNKKKRQERHEKRVIKIAERIERIKIRNKEICDYWLQICGKKLPLRTIKKELFKKEEPQTLFEFYINNVKDNINKNLIEKIQYVKNEQKTDVKEIVQSNEENK